ncbi:MAG: Gfo/Idh/MocA family oxidoreductase [Planctomycetaceae bacterium]
MKIVGLVDPDESRQRAFQAKFPGSRVYSDLRNMLDDSSIGVVSIATCNHWHCLAAIWAMQAGKDVYVEKPLSHSQWEGRQVVAAARKYNRIVQHGTQQRSSPFQAEIRKFLHEEQGLGEIHSCRFAVMGSARPLASGRRRCRYRRVSITISGSVQPRTVPCFARSSITTGTGTGIPVREKWGTGACMCWTMSAIRCFGMKSRSPREFSRGRPPGLE